MAYLTTIGLEVHVQLASKTKIFCGCAVEFGSAPNKNVCPVCLGLPGSLPVLNREVFHLGLKAVLALGGEPSAFVKFDRKNYFYPDLPKGYQISQFDHPLGKGGAIEITSNGKLKKIRLNRLHLEEDAGKLLHDQLPDSSVVDLNRAGTPLAEIVSEPDLESPSEAYEYLNSLKAILKAVGASECDMEKGQLRCDANVSVRKNASDPLGKRVEIKNLNSFKAVKAAIEHEVARQTASLEKGEILTQETRLWDDARQRTSVMRSKEDAHDYRYFPEPDLVPFSVKKEDIDAHRAAMPELPKAKQERLVRERKISEYNAGLLVTDPYKVKMFEELVDKYSIASNTAANFINNSMTASASTLNLSLQETKLDAEKAAAIQKMIDAGEISQQMANGVIIIEVMKTGKNPKEIVSEKGLQQVSDDSQLESWIHEAIQANPKVVADFKTGKDSAAMFLVGQVMKKSQGKANPIKVKELLAQKLAQV